VRAVNDSPVNTVPAPQSVVKNSSLFFSPAESNQISIADIDAGSGINAVQVTLSTSNGLLTLSGVVGLNFTAGSGTADANVTFTGAVSNINAALNGMRFTPTSNFAGMTQLQIDTNDLGHTGIGGALSDSDTVNINVIEGSALQFSATSYAVVEGSDSVKITVTRAGSGAAASVSYSTSAGTANSGLACGPGIDYVSTSGMLSWAAGDTTPKSFTVSICEDLVNEGDETINLMLSGATGDASLGGPHSAVVSIADAGVPVLLVEENTDHAIALDSVTFTRDPFSLPNPFNFTLDQHRRISLFVWRLALRPTDNPSDLIVFAQDDQGGVYPLTVEYAGAMNDLALVSQVMVSLPNNVNGAPRDLKVTVQLRGLSSKPAVIKIAGP
jgi:hypothetical protein